MDDRSKDLSFPDNLEYSTQFFNFTPRSFVDAIYNGLSEHVQDGLIEFYSRVRKTHPEGHRLNLTKPETVEKIKSVFDKHFDKLELYLRSNITQIPKNTLLPEDDVHRSYPVSNDDVIKKKEEIEKLEKKLIEAYHVERLLKEELEGINGTIASLTKMSSELKNTLNKFQDDANTNILKEFSIQTSEDRQLLNEIHKNISNDEEKENESENE